MIRGRSEVVASLVAQHGRTALYTINRSWHSKLTEIESPEACACLKQSTRMLSFHVYPTLYITAF
jgi:hypothetical protein